MKRWAAIILAAGRSSRFGVEDKLLADLHGKPVLEHVLDALDGLALYQTILVTRPGMPAIPRPGIALVTNPAPDAGMGDSLSLGAKALEPCDGVFVVLGDMPVIDTALLREMEARLEGHDIVVPEKDGRQGHPVLFGKACFDALKRCSGDRGARHLLASSDYRMTSCPVADVTTQFDIDTVEDLSNLRQREWH